MEDPLRDLGVDVIEAGFPIASPGDFESVQAIAREVERANAPTRTYGPRPGYAPQSSGAMVFNKVV